MIENKDGKEQKSRYHVETEIESQRNRESERKLAKQRDRKSLRRRHRESERQNKDT